MAGIAVHGSGSIDCGVKTLKENMSSYIQMGHDSENLVGVPGLEGFSGLILSPVNRSEAELARHIPEFRKKGEFDLILDPQLYCPRVERGQLQNHRYFPQDLDTTDFSSSGWWRKLIKLLVAEAKALGVNAVCSPALLPGKYSSDYYTVSVEAFSILAEEVGDAAKPVQTVCVSLKELALPADALRIASIVSSQKPPLVYIVVEANTPPRQEIEDAQNIFSLMVLVGALEKSGCPTLVSHCSSDMVLMKTAGASNCATGKFFNLRRFSRSRFDEPQEGGGGQLPYWFEQGLFSFLRRADIARLQRSGFDNFLCVGGSNNSFGAQIFEQFSNEPSKAWLALSWRQYLSWVEITEKHLDSNEAPVTVASWLKDAEGKWGQLESNEILLEEARNDGRWIRPWRQALADFKRFEL
jgi:hypothetical protein